MKGEERSTVDATVSKKADFVPKDRVDLGRSSYRSRSYDDKGKLAERTIPFDNEEEGYRVHGRMLDPDFVKRESVRLYEEVIAEYADVPYLPTYYRTLERKVRETPSATIADPKKKQEMIEVERYFATVKLTTLGQVAAGRLDDMQNLSVGKVAPDFEGLGVDGKVLKLSDYRGKVVVMVYWFSTCGPCLLAIPLERELAAKMKGRPFTLLGIVTDGRGEAARKVIESEGMTWPNVLGGGEKVANRYHITANPAYIVVDANGVIRSKGNVDAASIDKLAEELVAEAEADAKAKPTPRR